MCSPVSSVLCWPPAYRPVRPPRQPISYTPAPPDSPPPILVPQTRRRRRRKFSPTSEPRSHLSRRPPMTTPRHTPSPTISPAYTGRLSTSAIPALRMPEECMDPQAAYRFIHDELMLDGSSRLNLATFVTTWMDPEAEKLMAETFDKNMIDKDEYPATAAIEQRCVCMVADLFHAENLRDDDPNSATGVSTIGSSEAVMLGGLALKWRWKERFAGKDGNGWRTRTPNLVLGSNVQVVWEKFC